MNWRSRELWLSAPQEANRRNCQSSAADFALTVIGGLPGNGLLPLARKHSSLNFPLSCSSLTSSALLLLFSLFNLFLLNHQIPSRHSSLVHTVKCLYDRCSLIDICKASSVFLPTNLLEMATKTLEARFEHLSVNDENERHVATKGHTKAKVVLDSVTVSW